MRVQTLIFIFPKKKKQLVLERKVKREAALAYLRKSDRSRQIAESYFTGGKRRLYFDYTHLVCREAIEGKKLISSKKKDKRFNTITVKRVALIEFMIFFIQVRNITARI